MSQAEDHDQPESRELLKAKAEDAIERLKQLDSSYFHLKKDYRELRLKYDRAAIFVDRVKESLRELS